MPCKTPHQSTTSVIIVSVTLTFPVCSCMMKLKRCWINHHNLSRWTPRSLDTSVSFLNTSHLPSSHPAQRDTLQRTWRTRKSGCGWRRGSKRLPLDFRGAVYQKTSSDCEPGEPERFTRSERTYRLTCSQRTIWIKCCLHFKCNQMLYCTGVCTYPPHPNISKDHANTTKNSATALDSAWMIWLWIQDFQNWKNERNIDYICTIYSFLLYVCVFGFFYDLQTIRI